MLSALLISCLAVVSAVDVIIDLKSKEIQKAINDLSPDQLKELSELIGTRDRCTTIAVGPGATTDGSTINTHNSDCADCDWRVNKVPAKDWAPGSLRPVYQPYSPYPSRVNNDRGRTWRVDNLEHLPQRKVWETLPAAQTILGYIPQVNHTYALFEGMYAIMNEHQVGIGESTCAAKLWAAPAGFKGLKNGTALLEVNELSQIALERTTTARDAIQMMGDLAVKYGYYSATWDVAWLPEPLQEPYAQGEGGEALTVVDPYEAWMFHILPDDTGAQAIWVAQRIPDDHVTICANSFVIREVDPHSDDFMFSSNLWSAAKRLGWWDESMGKLDFLKTYAPQRYHPNYSTKRVWRVFDLAAPSLKLPFNSDNWGDSYPFSVKVDKKLSYLDVFNFSRDLYEGTPFDLTKGTAGGPYGDPNRWDPGAWGNMTILDTMQGEFPRAISIFRTSYSILNQARRHVPDFLSLSWIALYAPIRAPSRRCTSIQRNSRRSTLLEPCKNTTPLLHGGMLVLLVTMFPAFMTSQSPQ
jgi:dipeptidase